MTLFEYAWDYVRGVVTYWLPTTVVAGLGALGEALGLGHWTARLIIVLLTADWMLGTWRALASGTWDRARLKRGLTKTVVYALFLGMAAAMRGPADDANAALLAVSSWILAYVVYMEAVSSLSNLSGLLEAYGVQAEPLERIREHLRDFHFRRRA